MARIFITGSSDGLGLTAAQLLVEQGHSVVLRARSQQRADETQNKLPLPESVVVGDLTSITQARHVADQVNQLGTFDAVIHSAGVGYLDIMPASATSSQSELSLKMGHRMFSLSIRLRRTS